MESAEGLGEIGGQAQPYKKKKDFHVSDAAGILTHILPASPLISAKAATNSSWGALDDRLSFRSRASGVNASRGGPQPGGMGADG